MKSNKTYRLKTNPQEQVFHDKFIKEFEGNEKDLSAIIFGWSDENQNYPADWLTIKETNICLTMIQWLGSPVGQGFLKDCGFEKVIQPK